MKAEDTLPICKKAIAFIDPYLGQIPPFTDQYDE